MPQIPNKLYFRIGEVSDLVGVKPYVLRYWESEFTDIKPSKSKSGQRLYKRRDVELLVRIKGLLYEERFTINGARKRLKDYAKGGEAQAQSREQSEIEIKDPKAREMAPRQLEVFVEEQEEPSSERAALRSTIDRTSTKAFQKIRRDLKELLTVIRS